MEYETKSIVIGRMGKATEETKGRPCFVALFQDNNPHLSGKVPVQRLEFSDIEEIKIESLTTSFFLQGSDLVINDLAKIKINHADTILTISGEQSSE